METNNTTRHGPLPQVITPDGHVREILPTDGEQFTLEELQHIAGGYIDITHGTNFDIFERLFVYPETADGLDYNPLASAYAGYDLYGNVLHVQPSYIQ